MSKIIFIIGGSGSGKSAWALNLARAKTKKVAFIATGEPKDEEMKKRIARHKNIRPPHWRTFEEPLKVNPLLKKISAKFDCLIIDCLTLLASNLLLNGFSNTAIESRMRRLCEILHRGKADAIIVSNEVGSGIVPENKLARDFRDIAGRINQLVAKKATEVYFMVAGIPWRIK